MTDQLEYTFPEQISNTQRSLFVQCPQKWFWTYCTGYRKRIERSIDLRAGGAFAAGTEAARKAFYDEGRKSEEAIDLGVEALTLEYGDNDYPDHVKNLPAMQGALYAYFTQWPLETDYLKPFKSPVGSGIEFKFAVPLPIQHPVLDQPLLYGGRIDMIAEYRNSGVLWAEDDKTAKALGAQWRKKFRLDAQGTSYVWAAKQHGYPVGGFIIRGTSILKRSYGHEEVMEPRSQYQLDDWYEQLLRDVNRMICTFNDAVGSFSLAGVRLRPDRSLDKDACGAYGGCPFLDACGSPNPEQWVQGIIEPPDNGPVDEAALADLFN